MKSTQRDASGLGARKGGVSERMIHAGEIEIWTESFGDSADPTILLVMGPSPGILWPDELCERLAEGGRHVIRYDHRDTGRSTSVDFATSPYTLSDLAADAVGALDAYSVGAAHLVGFSGGGAIAQTIALERPERVNSLTSWGSHTLGGAAIAGIGQGREVNGLPGSEPKVVEAFRILFQHMAGDADESERIEGFVGLMRAFAGTLAPFDEKEARDLAKRVVVHTRDRGSAANHFLALASSPDRRAMLAKITAPTLVIHGTVDPAVPPPHGEATAKAIPGARLLTIEGLGHDFPRPVLPQIVAAILEHTA